MGLALMLAGCNGPIFLRVQPHVQRSNPRVVLFFADGLNRDLFRKWIADGSLPHIKRYIVDRGTEVEHAVSCLPSITYANTATLLTGRRPGHHEVIANKWFDRSRLFYQDYTYGETYRRVNNDVVGATVYEYLPDRYTVSIQSPLTRGVNRTYYNDMTAAITWWLGLLDWTDRLIPLRFEEVAMEVSRDPNGAWPTFVHAYFPALDEYGHRYSTDHWGYRYAAQNVDQQVHRVCAGLEAAGLLERTTLIFVSDHGMTPIGRGPGQRLSVKKALAERFGKRVIPATWPELSTDYYERKAYLDRYDTIVAPGAGRKWSIYFRFSRRWEERPEPFHNAPTFQLGQGDGPGAATGPTVSEMARWLAAQPAILIAAVPIGPDEVALHGSVGTAIVSRRGAGRTASYAYRVVEGSDPLGYASDPSAMVLVDRGAYSGETWLEATLATPTPDVPSQICEVFDTIRAGEIMLFAAPGCGFPTWLNAGHGSITAEELFVPMVFAGPDIPAGGKVHHARTCDVLPTILDILHVQPGPGRHPPIDGESLWQQLKQQSQLVSSTR